MENDNAQPVIENTRNGIFDCKLLLFLAGFDLNLAVVKSIIHCCLSGVVSEFKFHNAQKKNSDHFTSSITKRVTHIHL